MSDQEQPQLRRRLPRQLLLHPHRQRRLNRMSADRDPIGAARALNGAARAASLRHVPRCASSASRRRRRSITRRPSSCAALSANAARFVRAARLAPAPAISVTWLWLSSARGIWPCCPSWAPRLASSQSSCLLSNWSTGCSSTVCSAAGVSLPLDQFPYRSRTYGEEQNKSASAST